MFSIRILFFILRWYALRPLKNIVPYLVLLFKSMIFIKVFLLIFKKFFIFLLSSLLAIIFRFKFSRFFSWISLFLSSLLNYKLTFLSWSELKLLKVIFTVEKILLVNCFNAEEIPFSKISVLTLKKSSSTEVLPNFIE